MKSLTVGVCAVALLCAGCATDEVSAAAASGKPAIVFVGAHPDDTEGFAGTAFLLRDKYELHVVDLTGGEYGLGEAGWKDGSTARIRRAEEERACAFLGATPHFLGELDVPGMCHASKEATDRLVDILMAVKPVAIFTHWPVDTHPDHVQAAAVTAQARSIYGKRAKKSTQYYFYEVVPGETRQFPPLYSIDITSTIDRKLEMLRLYACQNPDDELAQEKKRQAAQRGAERKPAVAYAEVFTTYDGKPCKKGLLQALPEMALLK